MVIYTVSDIQGGSQLNKKQKERLIRHCNKYGLAPVIAGYYNDLGELLSELCSQYGYSRAEAKKVYCGSKEFCTFKSGEIVRLKVS